MPLMRRRRPPGLELHQQHAIAHPDPGHGLGFAQCHFRTIGQPSAHGGSQPRGHAPLRPVGPQECIPLSFRNHSGEILAPAGIPGIHGSAAVPGPGRVVGRPGALLRGHRRPGGPVPRRHLPDEPSALVQGHSSHGHGRMGHEHTGSRILAPPEPSFQSPEGPAGRLADPEPVLRGEPESRIGLPRHQELLSREILAIGPELLEPAWTNPWEGVQGVSHPTEPGWSRRLPAPPGAWPGAGNPGFPGPGSRPARPS